jgi:hypothetical protein
MSIEPVISSAIGKIRIILSEKTDLIKKYEEMLSAIEIYCKITRAERDGTYKLVEVSNVLDEMLEILTNDMILSKHGLDLSEKRMRRREQRQY